MRSHPYLLQGRFLLFLPFLLLTTVVAQAQSTGTITGIVKDAKNQSPLVGATVVIRDAADSTARPLGGGEADRQGAFSIERLPLGKTFNLEIRYIGYNRQVFEKITLSAAQPNRNMGTVLLAPTALDQNEIQVTAVRPQVRITADKTVYEVENNTSYTATNVSELLGQVPSIEVDQDGKVSLRGDDNVTIMMNDRPLTMPADQRNKFLQSLPANMVKDIEIRTNPGAQFDAKNQGGIINIVTVRTMADMFGGSINGGIDSRLGGNGGASLYYNGNTLNASLGGGLHRGPGEGSSTSMRLNLRDSIERLDNGVGSSESESNSHYVYGQVDYKFTEQLLASVSFNLNNWESNYTQFGTHEFRSAGNTIVGRSVDSSLPGPNSGNSGGYNSASALLKHTFEGDHKLSLDFSYNSHGYSGSSRYSSSYYRANGEFDPIRSTSRNSTFDRTNSTFISSLDYNNPVSDQLTLSVGVKNERNDLDNSTSVSTLDKGTGEFVVDPLQTNHYIPQNNIYALYGNAAYRPVEELSVQFGLRAEKANVSAKYASGQEIISRDYTNVFPSGSVGYNFTPQESVTLSYRRSIALPDIDALNPTRVKWSDFYQQSGNPDLDPEFTQSMELSYNTFWGMGNMVSIAPYYSTTDGNIENSQELIDGITNSTYANFNGSYSIGSQATLSLKPFSWLNFRISGDVYSKVNRGSAIPGDIASSATGYSGNGSFNADLMEGLTFGANMFFRMPASVGGMTQSGYSYLSFSLRQRLLDKKLTISLRVNDPFDVQRWEHSYEGPDFSTSMTSKWTSRYVGLNISYNFGTTPRMEQHNQEKTETKGSGGSSGGSGGGGGGGQ